VCRNDFLVPIPFPLPSNHSHSHSHIFPFPFQHCIAIPIFPITSTFIPTHSHSHFWHRLYIHYLKAEKYVYCVVNSKRNTKLHQKHYSSVVIIITITAYHCSQFPFPCTPLAHSKRLNSCCSCSAMRSQFNFKYLCEETANSAGKPLRHNWLMNWLSGRLTNVHRVVSLLFSRSVVAQWLLCACRRLDLQMNFTT